MEPKVKKRKQPSKSKELISNADVNSEANGISSQEKPNQGGDCSLSVSLVTDKCNQDVAQVLQPRRKRHDKAGGIIESAPSAVCDGIMEPKTKKRKIRSKSKKLMGSVQDADGNPKANGFTSQENSHEGGDLSLSVVSNIMGNQAVARVPQQRKGTDNPGSIVNQDVNSVPSAVCDGIMEPKTKKRKKGSKSKKLMGSVQDADGNPKASGFTSQDNSREGGGLSLSVVSNMGNQAVAHVLQQRKGTDNPGSIVNQDVDSVPSAVCDGIMEPKTKKRKRGSKSKKLMGSVQDADGNPKASGFTSQDNSREGGGLSLSVVSNMGSQAVAHVLQQRKRTDNRGSIVNQDIDSAPSTACAQNMEPEGENRKKRRNRGKKKKKMIDSTVNADTNPEHGGISSCRKLIILDLNGLLADIRSKPLEGYKPDKLIKSRAVYKRPFCDDFLQFCFETFDVAVWSSRKRVNVQQMLSFIMSKVKRKQLIFTRDQSYCYKTGFMTVENKDKPIFLKELKNVWNKSKEYNKSNTLLIDDSPCKALRNPPYTGIFPYTYECSNDKDDSLGPDGDLRLYLKKLAEADDVQEFVKENPFGQIPITESHPAWDFYSKVIAPKPPSKKKSQRTRWRPAVRNIKRTVFADTSNNTKAQQV